MSPSEMGILNNLTVTREEVGGDNGGKEGTMFPGTSIKDTGAKPKGGRIKGENWG